MRPVRLALTIGLGLMVVLALWVGWQTWQTSKSLSAAADDARSLQTALSNSDQPGVDRSLADLKDHASDAADRTSGTTWSLLTHLPVYGDDAEGVRLVSSVLDDLTNEGFAELAQSAVDLDRYLPQDGKLPLDSLEELQDPVARADTAFDAADERLSAQDASGYVGPLKTNYQDLAKRVSDASTALATAHKSLGLLPDMLGGQGPRSYLLIFQNNAEIRATGGLPGAWALITAEDGALTIGRQGTASDFPGHDNDPILPLSPEELELYGPQLGDYFQDANFTPDFPRSAALWHAWWDATFPGEPIDGVLSFDPVAMAYLLASTGPVQVDDVTLTQENAVDELLNKPYLTRDSTGQDAFFAKAAQSVFTAVTEDLRAPMDFLRGIQRGAREGRVHLASFTAVEQDQIADTQVAGGLPADDGASPRVQVAINDATGSKMSYYLRYRVDLASRDCIDGRQSLLGSMSVRQTLTEQEASSLPADITGGGTFGVQPGRQLLIARVYGPTNGEIMNLRVDGVEVDSPVVQMQNRPVALVVLEISGPDDVVVTWSARSGPGQFRDPKLVVTPSVVATNKNKQVASTC